LPFIRAEDGTNKKKRRRLYQRRRRQKLRSLEMKEERALSSLKSASIRHRCQMKPINTTLESHLESRLGSAAWTGIRSKRVKKGYFLEELQEMGMKVFDWDGM
jgi:hypothetical protein